MARQHRLASCITVTLKEAVECGPHRRERRPRRACTTRSTIVPASRAPGPGGVSSIATRRDACSRTRRRSRASARWRSRRPGRTSGSAPPRRPPPGDRPRRARPQAVPLPPALARGARRDQVRADARLRARCCRASARASRPDLARPGLPAREGAGDRRAAARDHADPRRQRGVRAAEPLVRPDDAARPRTSTVSRRAACASASAARAACDHVDRPARPRGSARIVKRCQDLPGPGAVPVRRRRRRAAARSSPRDVNDYLREVAGEDFTAKDFRTWAGTVLAAWALARAARRETPDGAGQAERRARHRGRRAPPRQHAARLPQVLRPPGGRRRLPRRLVAGHARRTAHRGIAPHRIARRRGARAAAPGASASRATPGRRRLATLAATC